MELFFSIARGLLAQNQSMWKEVLRGCLENRRPSAFV